jgi:hypothetical protein
MACLAPDIIRFLALPVGPRIHFDEDGPIEFKLDEVELKVQPGSYLDALSKTRRNTPQSIAKGTQHKRFIRRK